MFSRHCVTVAGNTDANASWFFTVKTFEADLPAWARADSFDEDLDEDGDEKPKQENLFD